MPARSRSDCRRGERPRMLARTPGAAVVGSCARGRGSTMAAEIVDVVDRASRVMFEAGGASAGCAAVATSRRFHESRFDFHEYAAQDPELDRIHRPRRRGWFAARAADSVSPSACRRCLASSIGCTTSAGPPEWVEREFEADQKDLIFRTILETLERAVPDRCPPTARRRRARRTVHVARTVARMDG